MKTDQPLQLHLFGAATPTGAALTQQVRTSTNPLPLVAYSRSRPSMSYADLNQPSSFRPFLESDSLHLWISFAPIWLLAPFIEYLADHYPERLTGFSGLIACSSSSAITKRFAFNRHDRDLVAKIIHSENQIITTCQRLSVPCRILRPTLIYGRIGSYSDSNLNRITNLMRTLPFLVLPSDSGQRQPIHATQLAAVSLELVRQFSSSGWDSQLPDRIALGGDTTLTYASMVRALQLSLPPADKARRCILLSVPNSLFFLSSTPLLLASPKAYEAILRMAANLDGFTPSNQLLSTSPLPFPLPDCV